MTNALSLCSRPLQPMPPAIATNALINVLTNVLTHAAGRCNQCADQCAKPIQPAVTAAKPLLQSMPPAVATNAMTNALIQCPNVATLAKCNIQFNFSAPK